MYSQMSKGIFLFFPCTNIHCTRFPTSTCFKCKSHFLELKFLLVTSQLKAFKYVQLIRSDGTPPTQAPPSHSGCPSPSFLSPGAPSQSRSRRFQIIASI